MNNIIKIKAAIFDTIKETEETQSLFTSKLNDIEATRKKLLSQLEEEINLQIEEG